MSDGTQKSRRSRLEQPEIKRFQDMTIEELTKYIDETRSTVIILERELARAVTWRVQRKKEAERSRQKYRLTK
jgi:uncharacterized coiled-coil protein SlyX